MSDRVTVSVVRRLHLIQRELDVIRCDLPSAHADDLSEAVAAVYRAEGSLMKAAQHVSPVLHRLYRHRHPLG